MNLTGLQQRALRDSRHWFPGVHETPHQAVVHFALGLAGEVGELVNLVKKVNRGSTAYADVSTEIAHEAADVLIYLLDLTGELGIDLGEAVEAKREILIARWSDPEACSPVAPSPSTDIVQESIFDLRLFADGAVLIHRVLRPLGLVPLTRDGRPSVLPRRTLNSISRLLSATGRPAATIGEALAIDDITALPDDAFRRSGIGERGLQWWAYVRRSLRERPTTPLATIACWLEQVNADPVFADATPAARWQAAEARRLAHHLRLQIAEGLPQ